MVNLRTFDLNLLRIFEAISHDGSVSKAADKLGMSQPAVSNALNRLRRQFDDPLFVRTQHGMEPTPKATRLAAAVHGGLTTIRAGLSSGVDFDPATSERRFTLLMTEVGEMLFLPVLLGTLKRSAPTIDITVLEHGVESYEDLLNNGIVDLAIGRIQLSDTFSSELIHSSPFAVVASRTNHFLKGGEDGLPSLTLADYLEAPHVVVEPRGSSPNPIRHALGPDYGRCRIALSVPHFMVLNEVLPGTDLLATVPKACTPAILRSGGLCTVAIPFPAEENFVYQWWHRRNNQDAGHRWLRSVFATAGV